MSSSHIPLHAASVQKSVSDTLRNKDKDNARTFPADPTIFPRRLDCFDGGCLVEPISYNNQSNLHQLLGTFPHVLSLQGLRLLDDVDSSLVFLPTFSLTPTLLVRRSCPSIPTQSEPSTPNSREFSCPHSSSSSVAETFFETWLIASCMAILSNNTDLFDPGQNIAVPAQSSVYQQSFDDLSVKSTRSLG